MRRGYGQYCPLALAAEFLCERWTLLIVSRLIDGCAQFNAIHRGVPRISPSLLAQRLGELERAGLVVRGAAKRGKPREYQLTQAGRDLEPIIEQLAVWGQQWARDMRDEDLDPAFLVWSMHLQVDTARMPLGRTVLEFGGIEPNPEYDTLMGAVELARREKVDLLLAVGGGSVLDGTKFIAAAVPFVGEPWDILTKGAVVESAGVTDILTKTLGTSNPHNVVNATLAALKSLRDPEQRQADLRGAA